MALCITPLFTHEGRPVDATILRVRHGQKCCERPTLAPHRAANLKRFSIYFRINDFDSSCA